MSKSIKANFVYNLICQLIVLVVPLITIPYLSRILLEDGIGAYSYAEAMVTYFTMFALLGSSVYAQREVGSKRGNIEETSRVFFEMLIFRTITMGVALFVYFFYVYMSGVDITLSLIVGLQIINCAVDISWFYQGNEEFKITAIVSTLYRVLSAVCIFTLVKSKDQVWVYALINSLTIFLTSLTYWLFLRKRIIRVSGIKPFSHLKGVFALFLPTIATQIYMVLDKSMIGWFTVGDAENGYYEYAEKIIRICMTLIMSLSTILLSRNASAFAENDIEAVKTNVYKGISYGFMVTFPICLGLIAVADIFVPVYFGGDFIKTALLLKLFSPLIIFMGFQNVIGMTLLLPIKKQNVYVISVIVSAIVNIILNFILVPKFLSIGAVVATIIAEFLCVSVQLFYVFKKGYLSIIEFFRRSVKYFISAIIMFLGTWGVGFLVTGISIIALLSKLAVGVIFYFLTLLLLKDEFFIGLLKQAFSLIKAKK